MKNEKKLQPIYNKPEGQIGSVRIIFLPTNLRINCPTQEGLGINLNFKKGNKK